MECDRCWCHTSSLLMGNSCRWGGLNCRSCRFPHPPGNFSPAILRCVAGHIMRDCGIYDFNGRFNLYKKNIGTCRDTLMNGHWEELIGKVEELLHATDDPDNYHVYIQLIIRYTSDGRQRFDSLLRPHVIKCVQGVIEAMSSSSASGCASALVDLRQRLVDRAEWIFGRRLIVNEVFDQVLRDHPDLHDAVKAQVNVSHSSHSPW